MALKWMYDRLESTSFTIREIIVTVQGQILITWDGQGYILGTHMIDVYLNGVLQKESSYTEVDPNSISFPADYLELGDLVSVRYKTGSINLGDMRVVGSVNQLASLHNPVLNEVVIVTSSRNMYIFTDQGWREFVIPFSLRNVGSMFLSEVQSITDSTIRTYKLNKYSFMVDMNAVLIFVDGKKKTNYIEIDNQTITFDEDLPAGSELIEFLIANVDSWEDSINHTKQHTYNASKDIESEVVKVNNHAVKTTTFTYNQLGLIDKEETVRDDGKVITRSYFYDSDGNVLSSETVITN